MRRKDDHNCREDKDLAEDSHCFMWNNCPGGTGVWFLDFMMLFQLQRL